jgi:monoamine oxidase
MLKKSLVIIGGGVSGLVAARELSSRFQVVLLEASAVFGGRILTVDEPGFPCLIEGGAEFVHGAADETIRLLEEAGIALTDVEGEFYRLQSDGRLKKEEGQVQGWDMLMEKMAGLEEDMTLDSFLNSHFKGAAYDALRAQAIMFAEGFDLADINTVSVNSLYQEWSHQSEDHRVLGGYKLLVDWLVSDCRQKGCELVLNQAVKKLDWQQGSVSVTTADGVNYKASRCVITVPLGVLQKEGIFHMKFTPAIPAYLAALSDIGFGTVIKVILSFKECFWEKDAGFFFSEEMVPTWWTQLPADVPVLTGWAGGPNGAALSQLSDEAVLDAALVSLANIFGKSVPEIEEKLVAHLVFNWLYRPAAGGAYSYATTALTPSVTAYINTPVDETLYFAGEGFYQGLHPGTVEAAIVNSLTTARLIS